MRGLQSRHVDDTTPAPVTAYLRHLEVERRMAANTLDAYRRDLRRLAAFAVREGKDVADLERRDLEAAVRESMSEGRTATSTARFVAGVRGFYRFLRIGGRIARNPAEELQAPRGLQTLPKFLTMEQVD